MTTYHKFEYKTNFISKSMAFSTKKLIKWQKLVNLIKKKKKRKSICLKRSVKKVILTFKFYSIDS